MCIKTQSKTERHVEHKFRFRQTHWSLCVFCQIHSLIHVLKLLSSQPICSLIVFYVRHVTVCVRVLPRINAPWYTCWCGFKHGCGTLICSQTNMCRGYNFLRNAQQPEKSMANILHKRMFVVQAFVTSESELRHDMKIHVIYFWNAKIQPNHVSVRMNDTY